MKYISTLFSMYIMYIIGDFVQQIDTIIKRQCSYNKIIIHISIKNKNYWHNITGIYKVYKNKESGRVALYIKI